MSLPLPTAEWVFPPTNAELLQLLRDASVRLSVSGRPWEAPTLLAMPRGAVSPDLAKAIQHHKPGLVRALRSHLFDALAPCLSCHTEFVLIGAERCAWCLAVADRVVEYAPNSAAERAVLAARERFTFERGSGITVPNRPSGTVPQTVPETVPTRK